MNKLIRQIHKETLFLSRNDVLSNIEHSIKEWVKYREKKTLYVYIPFETDYGSDSYLYYHFRHLLPSHNVIRKPSKNSNVEMLYLDDMNISYRIPSFGSIRCETITIITPVISENAFNEYNNHHAHQNINIFYGYMVKGFKYHDKIELEKFYNNIVHRYYSEDINIFYPVCLTYKTGYVYDKYINLDNIHKNLNSGFKNIYKYINSINDYSLANSNLKNTVPQLAKAIGLSNVSEIPYYIAFLYHDNYLVEREKYNPKHIDIYIKHNDKFKNDMLSDSRFITFYISMRIKEELYGHANFVVIDKESKTFSIFEPHGGYENYYSTRVTADFFKTNLPGYSYIESDEVGPQILHQVEFNVDEDGICYTLCILYGLLRVMNPKFSSDHVINEINHMLIYPDFGITIRKFGIWMGIILNQSKIDNS